MKVEVRLLGGFTVVVEGSSVPDRGWSRRHAAALVKLLALSPEGRLHRDRVVDTLWPGITLEAALPRLHKAAHYARTALGNRDAIVLKGEVVTLFPGADVRVDALAFEADAKAALSGDPVSPALCDAALALAGELLPDDLGETWLEEPRARLQLWVARLLRATSRWEELLRLDPADEGAHLSALREAVERGERGEALRRYASMERVLMSEVGVQPGPEAVALRERAMADGTPPKSSAPEVAPVAAATLVPGGLVEREAHLVELSAAVETVVRSGRGVVILVVGEAGAGKSALVQGFLGGVREDVTAFVGGCDDLLAPRSLGPFRDMATEHPGLAEALSGERIDDALPSLLAAFSAQPSVVVVEDIHWADDATLDVIRYIARRVDRGPFALLLTFRDTGLDADHPLRKVLGGLAGANVRRLALQPLSADGVRRLGAASPAEAAEIHRVTQGNPFFVTEILSTRDSAVPATVRDAVLARLGTMPPPVRTLLRRLSVIPTRTERWLAESLTPGSPELLIEGERSGMLVGETEWVSFRHELARLAIETSLMPGERVEYNGVVVSALLSRPDPPYSRVVHHAERSGQISLVLEYGPTVAREAGRLGAHRQAAEVLRVVLQRRHLLDPADVADLARRHAYSLYVVNRFEGALESSESAVRAAEKSDDPVLLADALLVLARVSMFARGPMRARQAAERAVGILEQGEDDARLATALTERARAHSNLATIGIVPQPCEPAVVFGERALEIAQRLGRTDIAAQAWCYLGDARLAGGDRRGIDDLRRAISLAASDTRVETLVRSYVNAAGGAYRTGRLDEALQYVADGLRAAADGEFYAGQYGLRLTAAAVRAARGEWDRSIADLWSQVQSPEQPGVMGALARSLLARLLARRGSPEAADVLATTDGDPAVADDIYVAGPLAVARVELGWLDGSLGTITDDARRALDLATSHRATSLHAELCAYLVRAGIGVPPPADPPGPWAPTLAGRWADAARAWATLGDRYEEAVVLAADSRRSAQERGVQKLRTLGAVATIPAV